MRFMNSDLQYSLSINNIIVHFPDSSRFFSITIIYTYEFQSEAVLWRRYYV